MDQRVPVTNDEACDALRTQLAGYVQVLDGTGGIPNFDIERVGPIGSYRSITIKDFATEALVAELKRRRDDGLAVAEELRKAEL